MRIPYWEKFCRGRVEKFWLGDETVPDEYFYTKNLFTRQILSNNKSLMEKVTKFPYPPHECSIERPNFKVSVSFSGYQKLIGWETLQICTVPF